MAAQAAMAVIAVASAVQQKKANDRQLKAIQDQTAASARQEQLRQDYAARQQRAQLKADLASRRAQQAAGGVGGGGGSSAAVLAGMEKQVEDGLTYSGTLSQEKLDALKSSTDRNLLGIEDKNKAVVSTMAGTVTDLFAPAATPYVTEIAKLV